MFTEMTATTVVQRSIDKIHKPRPTTTFQPDLRIGRRLSTDIVTPRSFSQDRLIWAAWSMQGPQRGDSLLNGELRVILSAARKQRRFCQDSAMFASCQSSLRRKRDLQATAALQCLSFYIIPESPIPIQSKSATVLRKPVSQQQFVWPRQAPQLHLGSTGRCGLRCAKM